MDTISLSPMQTASMENSTHRRRKTSSGEAFSFPKTPTTDNDFEFGSCLTPDSPASSTADHLFFNGRLLPHSYPFRPDSAAGASTSRTSSLLSSRSNSTSSSASSSARTSSSSDASDRRAALLYRQCSAGKNKAVSAQVYGSSQRWRFIAAAPNPAALVPALTRDASRRRSPKNRVVERESKKKKKKKVAVVKPSSRPSWRLGRRIFWWFVSACKECHAIEPSPRKM